MYLTQVETDSSLWYYYVLIYVQIAQLISFAKDMCFYN